MISDRIEYHREELRKLEARMADRVASVSTDIQYNHYDVAIAQSHLNAMREIEVKIACQKAVIEELGLVEVIVQHQYTQTVTATTSQLPSGEAGTLVQTDPPKRRGRKKVFRGGPS